jgi:sugar transferase (PEP-CTERM/EpsH1 system associated)
VAGIMTDLLFLSHRIPFPPEKGEKIRAWHIFEHLARSHRIHLGCFVDDPADAAHIPTLRALCADLHAVRIDRRTQKLKALLRARPGRPLTLGYFHDAGLKRWVDAKLAAGIEKIFVYCSAMAPYAMHAGRPAVLDMVDIDSEKWTEYAATSAFPARLVWAREGRTLLAFERAAALAYDRALFVSPAECARFATLAPETRGRIDFLENGVDLDRFAPANFPRPVADDRPLLTFTGTMDYWPNADAVLWFAREVFPRLRARNPAPRFAIVGTNPTPEVQRLAESEEIIVTGRVADVRPWVAHADAVVAPLRIARGIQNKVLEAMAMGRPVVASPQAFEGVRAEPGRDLLVADGAEAMAEAVAAILDGRHPGLGSAARAAMEQNYPWPAVLARLDAMFGPPAGEQECQAKPHTVPAL